MLRCYSSPTPSVGADIRCDCERLHGTHDGTLIENRSTARDAQCPMSGGYNAALVTREGPGDEVRDPRRSKVFPLEKYPAHAPRLPPLPQDVSADGVHAREKMILL